ncbi:MAG: recombinase family protein [Oscillospiraceae bacterium]|nr:recombinase family protein [Oscillospiraceae bacterium]
MNVVIYARYSSHNQTEQSIEGQLDYCYRYAEREGHTVIEEYIDRALTATSDKRPEFQRMIADSEDKKSKVKFEAVLVYRYDRFSRNQIDDILYTKKLAQNGVVVISVTEPMSDNPDDPTAQFMRGIIREMNAFYSAELGQKVTRGMNINAEKHLSNGGTIPLGFKTVDKVYVIDEETAPIIREIFDRAISGDSYTEIADSLNARGIKTIKGGTFAKGTIPKILQNVKYKGTYKFGDVQIPDAIPRIIDDETFRRAQEVIERNGKARTHSKAKGKDEYLLTTKLFCGYCRDMMVGMSGRSQTGAVHRYYACKNARKGTCHKKHVRKEYIEDLVISACKKLLTESRIKQISRELEQFGKRNFESTCLYSLQKQQKKLEKQKNNLLDSISDSDLPELRKPYQEKLLQVMQEIKVIEQAIEEEKENDVNLSADEISDFLHKIKSDCTNSMKSKKALISTFVNRIYLYDDKITIVFNSSDKDATIDFTEFEEPEKPDETLISGKSSTLKIDASPQM